MWKVAEYKTAGFQIGNVIANSITVLTTEYPVFTECCKKIANEYEASLCDLDFSYYPVADTIEKAVSYMTAYVKMRSSVLFKYADIFGGYMVSLQSNKSYTDTFDKRELKTIDNRTTGKESVSENSPIGETAESDIVTPNIKDNETFTDNNTHTETGGTTLNHKETAHDPIEDLRYLSVDGYSLNSVVCDFVRFFVYEFNAVC